jgi:hypothetical protein
VAIFLTSSIINCLLAPSIEMGRFTASDIIESAAEVDVGRWRYLFFFLATTRKTKSGFEAERGISGGLSCSQLTFVKIRETSSAL